VTRPLTGSDEVEGALKARVRRCAVSYCRVACHPRAGPVIVSRPVRWTGPIQTAQPESLGRGQRVSEGGNSE
jgi:hypothetical protein